MFTNSNILGELYDTEYTIYKESNLSISIRPYTNYWIDYPYFVLKINRSGRSTNQLDTDFCRISMKEPRYLYYEYESLVLNEIQIDHLISILKDKEIWKKLLSFISTDSQYDDEDFQKYYDFSFDSEIPDYSQLKTFKPIYVSIIEQKMLKFRNKILDIDNNITLFDQWVLHIDKRYKLYLNFTDNSYQIVDKISDITYKPVSIITQEYIDGSSDNDIHLLRSFLNREIYTPEYNIRLNLIEFIYLCYIKHNNLKVTDIDIPYIKE